jgi:hypothetical protein
LSDLHNGKRKGQKNTKEWLFSKCLLGVVLVDNHDANSAPAGGGEDNDDEEEPFDTSNYDFSSMPLSSIAATRTIVLKRLTQTKTKNDSQQQDLHRKTKTRNFYYYCYYKRSTLARQHV